LPLDDRSCDIAVSALVLDFVPDPYKALSEMKRITVTGGFVAFYVQDYCGGGLELLKQVLECGLITEPGSKGLH
jgi:ubiquinone/menaquinone biosynthesis C-methylase UbiE